MNQKDFQKYVEILSTYSNDRKNRRMFSDIFLGLGALAFAGSVASWMTASRENRAYRERLALFLGLFVPSCLLISNRLLGEETGEEK